MKINRLTGGKNGKGSWLAALGILTMLVSLLFTSGTGHAQTSASGTVVAWGRNSEGQTNVPAGLSDIAAVSAGFFHNLALKNDGTVVSWGGNAYGQTTIPAGLSGIIAVAAGESHSLALKSDGTVFGWGRNLEGQTTIPAELGGITAIDAGCRQSLALKNDGTVVGWGGNTFGEATIPAGLSGVTAIAAGCDHNLALKNDGTVVGWGGNSFGQAIIPAGLSDVTAVAAGYYYSLALKSDGTVVAWGSNTEGQGNIPAGLSGVTAVSAGGWHSLALKNDGTIVAWGWNGHGQTSIPAGLSGVTAISAGANHSLALVQTVPVGHHPVGLNDSYSTNVNTTLTVAVPGVLSNDTDEDGDPLSAFLVSDPAHGTLTLNVDGSFDYMPATNYAGPDSFTYKANDGQADSNNATVNIAVQYSFTGFFEPVDNPGPGPRYVFNSVKAGSAVPVKFSLVGDQGLSIFAPSSPTSKTVKCTAAVRTDPIEQTVTAGYSSLSYDATSDIYTYAWKTEKKWAGTCRLLTVQLSDGTEHLAYFRFK